MTTLKQVNHMATFDAYEKMIINKLLHEGKTSFDEAVDIVVNSCDGDRSQLSDGLKRYLKARKAP